MLLVLDVGNTNTVLGVFEADGRQRALRATDRALARHDHQDADRRMNTACSCAICLR